LKGTLVGSALAISIVVVSASIASDQPRGDYAVDAAGEPVVDSTSV